MSGAKSFRGEIKVASRIVDYLSSGLYESPAACLKELINNSFDADASLVEVFVKPDANRIIVEDDGLGMNREEFRRHFDRISESHKRDETDVTPSGRPKIGMIGIGAIAANELCDEMEIFSTKPGSDELLHVSIYFAKMRLPAAERERDGGIAKADYVGEVLRADPDSHFTRIFLNKVRGEARSILASAGRHPAAQTVRSLYGLGPESVVKMLRDPTLKSWSEFDSYSKTMLQVALSVPVTYFRDWIPNQHRKQVADLQSRLDRLRFSVTYDATELHQPIVLSPTKRSLCRRFDYTGEHVSAGGYFYAQHGTMKPQDLQGLLIRIRNASVGGYDSSFLDFPAASGSLLQRWVSAEVWADDRLEAAMNIDRRTLRTSHPAFVELQVAVHQAMDSFLSQVRKELYGAGSDERERARAGDQADRLQMLIRAHALAIGQPAVDETITVLESHKEDASLQRWLTRKFTVTELFRLVLDVAEEVLDRDSLERFVRILTRRITG